MRSVRAIVLLIGVFLIGLGIFALLYNSEFYTERKKVVQIGPVEASVHVENPCRRLPNTFGALIIIAGGALVLLHITRRSN